MVQFFPSDSFDQTISSESGLEVCGMLGTTALGAIVTEINYPENTILFKTSGKAISPSLKNATKASLKIDPLKSNLSWVSIDFKNGEKSDFNFDTGCSSSMKITPDLAKKLGLNMENDQYAMPDSFIGNQIISGVRANASRRPFNFIGYGFLRQFKITLDYPGGFVYFEK